MKTKESTFSHTVHYVCECGREFTNSQAFNGHKCHCKIHQESIGNLHNWIEYTVKRQKSIGESNKANSAKKKQQELDLWISEQHTCERCGKVMTTKYGSGRFCCSSCAHVREHTDDTKRKISESLIISIGSGERTTYTIITEDGKKRRYSTTKKCFICNSPLKNCNKSGLCQQCLNHTTIGKDIRKETGKVSYLKMKEAGTHQGWKSRNIHSYPEIFWCNVLDNNGISYEMELPVKHIDSNYFLDFYIEKDGIKIDLEIDGKQHKYQDRVESDSNRDEYLKNLGYIVYRVEWNEINTDGGKKNMKNKIESFIDFYNNI